MSLPRRRQNQLERVYGRRIPSFLVFLVFFLYFSNYRIEYMQRWMDYHKIKSLVSNESESENVQEDEPDFDLWNSNHSDSEREQACPIPKLKPYSKPVKEYWKKKKTFHSCEKEYPLLFDSTVVGEILPTKKLGEYEKMGIQTCCYRVFHRPDKSDDGYKTLEKCYPLSLNNSTKIPPTHEFISIRCRNNNKDVTNTNGKNGTLRTPFILKKGTEKVMDMHAFIHVKPEVELRQNQAEKVFKFNGTGKGARKVNIVIFGLDAVSRMNFLRTMPKTYDFLMKKLNAVDMAGYNKVADNTFPNIMPMLTNLSVSEVGRTCGSRKVYDECPFIWKQFAKQGYRTSYAEDASSISIFNFERRGFTNPPTDYYLRPFSNAARSIATQNLISAALCYGPRLGFQVLLDNMKKFVYRMSRAQKPHFHFTWATSLSHDYLNAVELGDKPLLSTMEWLHKFGYLNETVFILLSDHGQRVDAFRDTLQGQLEDRLPFTILILPEWMRTKKYSKAYQNLVGNKNRLVTTFDLHETLSDLLDLGKIETRQIQRRSLALYEQVRKNLTMPRGISLFLPIPKERTCTMAGIQRNYCSCNYLKPVPTDNEKVKKAATIAVKKINSIVKKYENCAALNLSLVKMAQHAGQLSGGRFDGYLINFETLPGKARFEALVSKSNNRKWEVTGTISRTNLYGNQSHCVHDSVVKLYCFCVLPPGKEGGGNGTEKVVVASTAS